MRQMMQPPQWIRQPIPPATTTTTISISPILKWLLASTKTSKWFSKWIQASSILVWMLSVAHPRRSHSRHASHRKRLACHQLREGMCLLFVVRARVRAVFSAVSTASIFTKNPFHSNVVNKHTYVSCITSAKARKRYTTTWLISKRTDNK